MDGKHVLRDGFRMAEMITSMRSGDLIHLIATHEITHSGQISVVRRLLGKPVMF